MRSHYCGTVTDNLLEKTVHICGWVHRRRDHGGIIFVDLRDRTGLLQVVFDPKHADMFALADSLRSEYVIQATGRVRLRPEGQENPNITTGKIEIDATNLTILNQAQTPPFPLDEHQNVGEDVRLKYRYIDLRRPDMQQRLVTRTNITQAMREFLVSENFLDIETPVLTKATPEGARDYLVPSRTHGGQFFALPQSPQLFKQLLMMSGMDRYYQIVKCFRDEDLRADRQPEFTQLDIEMSFVDEQAVMTLAENLVRHLFKRVLDIELPHPFPRMPYAEAMSRFGSDKPDMRNPLELVDIDDLVAGCHFNVFATPAQSEDSRVAILKVANGCEKMTRKMLDGYGKFVEIYGAKGLAYIKVNDLTAGNDGLQSPILKFLDESLVKAILHRVNAENGDVIFFGADKYDIVCAALGALRNKIADDMNLYQGDWAPLWVTDFPMFEKHENRWQAMHHPFTAPSVKDADELRDTPIDQLYSRAYDIVLNGYEIGGGSIRIDNTEMQQAVLGLLGIDEQEAQEKFGFLLDALKYGAPPHGGIAFGLDRITMLMTGTDNIRDVIAFPKTQTASCLLTSAPSAVEIKQLQELSIRVNTTKKSEA